MKSLVAALFFVFAPFSLAQSPSGSDILKSAVADLPPCALQCTLTTIAASTCQLTNIDCIKNNKDLLRDLTVCVKSSCRIREALTAKKFLEELIGAPIRNKKKLGTLTTLIVGGMAVLAYLLRAVARLPYFGGNWGADDWVITADIIIIVPLTTCAYILNQHGLGTDMWLVPFDDITKILEIFYFTELFYLTTIALTKISVLLFYLRIFPHQWLRRAVYVTVVLCVLYIVVFVTITALQCIPVRNAWERWDGEHHGKCLNLNADAWLSAGINIFLDLVVIALPMRELKNLTMSRRRKAGVMLMFLGGGFVTIVSILRLKYLVQFANTDNVTWDYLPVGYWSAVEAHVGVMVACLPAIRSLQRAIRERLFPRTPTSTSYYEDDKRDSKRKNIHKNSSFRIWSSIADGSLMSTLNGSKLDKEDFVQLDEYDTRGSEDDKQEVENHTATRNSSERPLTRSPNVNEGVIQLPPIAAQFARPSNGIMVQTEYSVNRANRNSGQIQKSTSGEKLINQQRNRF